MYLDIIFIGLMVLALFRGFARGLIMSLVSFIAFFVGLAAALKLSAALANYLSDSTGQVSRWWPVLAFLLVFLLVAYAVSLAGRLLEKFTSMAMLGWVNRIGGFALYALMYTILFSVAVFYLRQLHVVQENDLAQSRTWPLVGPMGPAAMRALDWIIPMGKDVFEDLQRFFQGAGETV